MASILNLCLLLACGAYVATAFAITGVQAGVRAEGGPRPFRENILDFQKYGRLWDLYILGLQKFSQTNQSDQFSYYQVSGIHGYPQRPWDGVVGSGYAPGYCSHSSILFPMWHRPYLLLYEQLLWRHVKDIAAQYPDNVRKDYEDAADQFRIPYWDWSTQTAMPDVVWLDQLTVNTPQGPQTITNPLKQYNFNPFVASDFANDAPKFNYTVRTPDAAGNCQVQDIDKNLAGFVPSTHDAIYKLLTGTSDYATFATVATPHGNSSVEAIHGLVHNEVGGDGRNNSLMGHMTMLPYSAFDPLFMLHHCNVDRLVTIWQALYPDSWIVPQKSVGSTYMSPAGTLEDGNTPLYPFHADDNGTFHTSNSVRYLKNLGYSYPEVWDFLPRSAAALTNVTRANVNLIYHPEYYNLTYTNGTNSTRNLHPRDARPRLQKSAALAAEVEWNLHVVLQGSLENVTTVTLHAPDSTQLTTLIIDPRPTSPFAPLMRTIPLTAALLAASGGSDNLRPDKAVEFVKGVRWEALGLRPSMGGVGGSKIATLGATVRLDLVARTVEQPKQVDEFPKYGEWKECGKMKLAEDGYLTPA